MHSPVLEAVPNVSEGRDPSTVRALVDAVEAHPGVEVVDVTSDPDHHRSVLTFLGPPDAVEDAAVSLARAALERIDLRGHRGVHPRVGVLDVLPFVPLRGLTMDDAVRSARRVGPRLAELGLPIWYYGQASDPPGRPLAELRRGGVEGLAAGFPPERTPDEAPEGCTAPHPSAGVTCVGARDVLLAWNVDVAGLTLAEVRDIAAGLRERGGGFRGLRALGLRLDSQDRLQISMNLEDPVATSPLAVFEAIERACTARGGRVRGTEVIGLIPDALVLTAAANRLQLPDLLPSRLLSHRTSDHLLGRLSRVADAARYAVGEAGAPARPTTVDDDR